MLVQGSVWKRHGSGPCSALGKGQPTWLGLKQRNETQNHAPTPRHDTGLPLTRSVRQIQLHPLGSRQMNAVEEKLERAVRLGTIQASPSAFVCSHPIRSCHSGWGGIYCGQRTTGCCAAGPFTCGLK